MKTTLLLPALFIFLLASCTGASTGKEAKQDEPQKSDSAQRRISAYLNDCIALKKAARKMDSILLQQTEINNKSANDAIKAFTEFAYHCSGDSTSPIYMIKTAQVSQAINNMPQAKVVLEKCIADYPNFKDRPAAIFLLAQLYDEAAYLNNEEEAKVLYNKIIDEYPKSDWAASAKGALKFIGKTDEQIMEELKKKNR